jgi:hypothetical protein
MAVYQRSPLYGDAPGLREDLERQRFENERAFQDLKERAARMKRERDGIIDLVEINGVWQVPSR